MTITPFIGGQLCNFSQSAFLHFANNISLNCDDGSFCKMNNCIRLTFVEIPRIGHRSHKRNETRVSNIQHGLILGSTTWPRGINLTFEKRNTYLCRLSCCLYTRLWWPQYNSNQKPYCNCKLSVKPVTIRDKMFLYDHSSSSGFHWVHFSTS